MNGDDLDLNRPDDSVLTAPPDRSRRTTWIVVAALVVAVIAGGAIRWWTQRREASETQASAPAAAASSPAPPEAPAVVLPPMDQMDGFLRVLLGTLSSSRELTAWLATDGRLGSYTGDSLRRVGLGYGAAAVLGVAAGLLLGRAPFAQRLVNPLLQMLRPISPLAWMPLAVIWFGVTDLAPVFLIFLAAFFPVVVATLNAVRNIPPMYFQAASNFGLSRLRLLARVVFPAIVPRVLTGLRIAL